MSDKNPFKFLEPFKMDDPDRFSGRDNECDKLYELTRRKDIVLVFGKSGVGKTSLVNWGLANRLPKNDWVPIVILRKDNIIDSLKQALKSELKYSGDLVEVQEDAEGLLVEQLLFTESEDAVHYDVKDHSYCNEIKTLAKEIYWKYYKPVYLIFDQLEELYIHGNKEELKQFNNTIKTLLSVDSSICKIVLILREEYISHIHEFETSVKPIYRDGLKLDLIRQNDAKKVFQSILNSARECIELEEEFSVCEDKIIEACSEDNRLDVQSLQVFFFVLWDRSPESSGKKIFSRSMAEELISSEDLLRDYIIQCIARISNNKSEETSRIWHFLQGFISDSLTKKEVDINLVGGFEKQTIANWTEQLLRFRILKKRENSLSQVYLVHDCLAPIIKQFEPIAVRAPHPNPPLKGKNPYKGLRQYTQEDEEIFFGRTGVVNECYQSIKENNLLVLVGPSGCGKSSIVKAGILPKLREDGYQIVEKEPGGSPRQAMNFIRKDYLDVVAIPKLAVYIDQFEELSTSVEREEERNEFITFLKSLIEKNEDTGVRQVKLILSVRADYEHHFDNRFPEWVRSKKIIKDPTEEEVRQIIVEPSYLAGLQFQPAYLVDIIISEVKQSSGFTPLLSYTLQQLYIEYEKSGRGNSTLTEEDYNRIGGVTHGLRNRANAIYMDLQQDEKEVLKQVMLRMVSLGTGQAAGLRIYASDIDYVDDKKDKRAKKVLESLIKDKLLVTGNETYMFNETKKNEQYYEPAHDSLIRNWDKINEWTNLEGTRTILLQRELDDAIENYVTDKAKSNSKMVEGRLWHEHPRLSDLAKIIKQPDGWLNTRETEFILKSMKLRRQRKLARYLILMIVGLLVLSLAGYILLVNQKARSMEKFRETEELKVRELQQEELRRAEEKQREELSTLREKYFDSLQTTNTLLTAKNDSLLISKSKLDIFADSLQRINGQLLVAQETLNAKNQSLAATIKERDDKDSLVKALNLRNQRDSEIVVLNQIASDNVYRNPAYGFTHLERTLVLDPSDPFTAALKIFYKKERYFESLDLDSVLLAKFSYNGERLLTILDGFLRSGYTVQTWGIDGKRLGKFNAGIELISADISKDGTKVLLVTKYGVDIKNITGAPLGHGYVNRDSVLKAHFATDDDRILVVTKKSIDVLTDSGVLFRRFKRENSDILDSRLNGNLIQITHENGATVYDLNEGKLKYIKDWYQPYLTPSGNSIITFQPPFVANLGIIGYYKVKLLNKEGKKVEEKNYAIRDLQQKFRLINHMSFDSSERKVLIQFNPIESQLKQNQRQQAIRQKQVQTNSNNEKVSSKYVFILNRDEQRLDTLDGILQKDNLHLSKDGQQIIYYKNGSLDIYDIKTGKFISRTAEKGSFIHAEFSPKDNQILLSISEDADGVRRLKLWRYGSPADLRRRELLMKYEIKEKEKKEKERKEKYLTSGYMH